MRRLGLREVEFKVKQAVRQAVSQVSVSPEPSFQAPGGLLLITNHLFIISSSLVLKVKLTADWAWLELISSAFLITFWTRAVIMWLHCQRVRTTSHTAAGPGHSRWEHSFTEDRNLTRPIAFYCKGTDSGFSDSYLPSFLFRCAKMEAFRWHTNTPLCVLYTCRAFPYTHTRRVERGCSMFFRCCCKLLF